MALAYARAAVSYVFFQLFFNSFMRDLYVYSDTAIAYAYFVILFNSMNRVLNLDFKMGTGEDIQTSTVSSRFETDFAVPGLSYLSYTSPETLMLSGMNALEADSTARAAFGQVCDVTSKFLGIFVGMYTLFDIYSQVMVSQP